MSESQSSATAVKISNVALELFAQEGYYNTSIRKIASEAGIALGLMYSYYQNKEALLKSMIRDGMSALEAEFKEQVKDNEDIGLAIKAAYQLLEKYEKHWRLLQIVRLQNSLKEFLQAEIDEVNLFFLEYFRTLLKIKGIPKPRTEARIVWGALDGIFLQRGLSAEYSDAKAIQLLMSRYGS